MIIDLA